MIVSGGRLYLVGRGERLQEKSKAKGWIPKGRRLG